MGKLMKSQSFNRSTSCLRKGHSVVLMKSSLFKMQTQVGLEYKDGTEFTSNGSTDLLVSANGLQSFIDLKVFQ